MSQVGGLIGLVGRAVSGAETAQQAGLPKPFGVAEMLGLKLGDVIEAGIVEDLGKGEGIIDLGGRLVRAVFPDGLTVGMRAALRVVSTGPPLVLKLPDPGGEALAQRLSPPAATLSQVVNALVAVADAEPSSGLGELLRQFPSLRLPSSPAELSPLLSQLIRKSGLFHEFLLARGQDPGDLKSLALRITALSSDPSLLKVAEALLGHIEAYQARSTLESAVVIPFVLPWGEEPIQGEWMVEERAGQRASGEAESGLLRIRLEMPRLGPVEAIFQWGPAGNAIRLRIAPHGVDAVSSRLSELADALSREAAIQVLALRVEPLPPAAPKGSGGLIEVFA